MKRLFFFLFLFLFPLSLVHAGRRGSTSDYDEKLWRVTKATGTFSGMMFASAPIVISEIIVGSPTVNISPSYIAIMPSTSNTFGSSIMASTPIFVNTNVNAASTSSLDVTPKKFNLESSSWTYMSKTGGADVAIKWDFINPSDNSKPDKKIP